MPQSESAPIPPGQSELREPLRTLRGILLVGAVVLSGMVLISPIGIGLRDGLLLYGPGVLLHVLHWQWLRWRPTRAVAVSHCLLYFVWVTLILAFRTGGMTAPAAFVYPPLVLMAGLVWSGRAALGMAILTSASGGALLWLQLHGWLPPPAQDDTPFQLWLVMTACVVITASLIRFALGTLARSNEERLDNERRFADLVRAAPDAMLFVDRHGLVRGANPALWERFGRAPETIAGQTLESLALFDAPSLAGLQAEIAATLVDGRPRTAEWPARYKDGSLHPVEAHCYRVDGAGSDSRVCVSLRDLSEREQRRKLEERLREGQRLEALGRLAGGVAHDFNNLLTVIMSSTDLIAMSSDGRESEELTAIADSAKRAALLTRQLLAFGRRQVLLAESVELNRAIEQSLPLLERLLHAEIKLEFSWNAQACYAAVDRSQLDQILINLIVNARDAMPLGGVVTIECGRGRPGGSESGDHAWTWFRVSDTGVGIPQEIQDRIFEPFFTTKRGERGTGLGLSTVHGIVTQSGGSIRIESQVGAGTTFYITLPSAAAPVPAIDRAHAVHPRASPARVLVVDDDSPVRTVLRAILESGGHQVTAVESAADALQAIDGEPGRFDLLLTDVVMSGMNGPSLAASARQRQPGLRVLYTSGHAEELLDARGVLSSARHFIAKPFVARELLLRVQQILADPPPPGVAAQAEPQSRA